MIMTAFRIQNYRSVIDSGWIDIYDVTLIVGKIESGKTSLLKALWKFNPFVNEPFDVNLEWPRGRRRELSGDKAVVTVRFSLTPEEQNELCTLGPSTQHITGVEIECNYNGEYIYNFLPHNPERQQNATYLTMAFERLKAGYQEVLNAVLNRNQLDKPDTEPASESLSVKGRAAVPESSINDLNGNLPYQQSVQMVSQWLPTFIYMDDYAVFKGSVQLDELKQNKDTSQLTAEDRTILNILEMAGLNLDEEVRKGTLVDKEQRMLDMYEAGLQLTEEIARRWSQKKYEVKFQADEQHFITFVKDLETKTMAPLEECSKGLQWSFSFDMTLMHDTNGKLTNAVVLLDEPGLLLHPAEQSDLIERIRQYAQNNQLIYTTHLPFMIDFTRLESIYVAEENVKEGTIVYNCREISDKDSRSTLQEALGFSWSQSLLADQLNLIVEDVTDYSLLTYFSKILIEAGKEGLDEQLIITPAGGAGNMVYLGNLLHDMQQNSIFLLNTIPDKNDREQLLMAVGMEKDENVISLSRLFGFQRSCAPEDWLPESYYLGQVNIVYRIRLDGNPLVLPADESKSIIQRVTEALAERNIHDFNRIRVARRIMQDLDILTSSEITSSVLEKYAEVIHAINAHVKRMKDKSKQGDDAPPTVSYFVPAPGKEETKEN